MSALLQGLGITSDDQLRDLADAMGIALNYIGFADDIPNDAPLGPNVINLGGRETYGEGTHWTLWYVSPDEGWSCYFDSYGAPPEDRVVELSPKPLLINQKQVQGDAEEFCGIWAITCAAFIVRAKDKKNALERFLEPFNAL